MVSISYDIRPATVADIEAIATFQTACWREAYRGLVNDTYLDNVGESDRAIRWRERLLSRSREIAIGWTGTEIAGVVSWGNAEIEPPGLELKSLYVGAIHRGSGLALLLANTALEDRAAQLWVFEGNQRAQKFYRKIGFTPDGMTKIDADTGLLEIRLIRQQPSSGRRFAVVGLFETLGVGNALSRSAWPAHVTLASNFVADVSAEDVARAVNRTDALNDPIVVQFGESAHFGPHQNVPVQLVHSTHVLSLHHSLADQLELLPDFAADEPEYWREGYRPHVTLTPTIEVEEGDQLTTSCIAVVTVRGDVVHVESVFTNAHGSGSTGRRG